MARSHQNEEAHRRFATEHKCSMRTAQRHSARNSVEWQTFIAADHRAILKGEAPASSGESIELPPAPAICAKAPEEMTPEEYVLWKAYVLLQKAAHTSSVSKDPLERSAAMRHFAEMVPRFFQARQACQRAEERDGKVVSITEFQIFRAIVERPAQLVKSLPELAPRLNPSAPAVAREELLAWLQQAYNPAIEAVIKLAEEKGAVAA